MCGVRVAVEQLDRILRPFHERVVDVLAHEHCAHRDRTVGQRLRRGDHVRQHVEVLRAERRAEPAEARDDFVEDQQDAVLVADRAQPLQIALRRQQHAGRAGHRLDDHGRNRRCVVQRDQALQIVGEMRAPLGHAARERVVLEVVRMPQVIYAGQHRPEELAVVDHAADGRAAEADAVIALLASDQSLARRFAAQAVIRDCDFQCRVDRLGARVREEHVIDVARCKLDQAGCELEAGRVPHLERRRVFHRRELLADGLGDFLAAVTGVHAPQPGDAVEHLAAVLRPVVHTLGAREQSGVRLELTVGGERHPECFEIGALGRCHGVLFRLTDGSEKGRDDKKIRQATQILRKLFIAFGPECRLS